MSVTYKLRGLVFDIETIPGEAYFFQAKTRFIPHTMVKKPPIMACWAASWIDGKQVYSDYISPKEINARDDSRIVGSIAELMREADFVVAHHGDQFDIPWVRGRAWVHDLEPLGPVASLDTKKLSSRDFAMTHNNLDALLTVKDLGNKTKTDFSWWRDLVELDSEGQAKAMRRMLRYCKRDTKKLKELLETMIPHVNRLPRLIDTTDTMICVYCASTNIHKRGKKRTKAYNYQQYQCNDCQGYFSDKTHDRTNMTRARSR